MSAALQLIRKLSSADVRIVRRGDNLHIEAPAGSVTSALRISLSENKADILRVLSDAHSSHGRLTGFAKDMSLDNALVDRLSDADAAECKALSDNAAKTYLAMLAEDAVREAGGAPQDETTSMLCAQCGPVWTTPEVAAVLPVVEGWPRALGCPRCHIRSNGRRFSRPTVACGGCRHFVRDPVNPVAGAGTCAQGVEQERMYPAAQHACAAFQPGAAEGPS